MLVMGMLAVGYADTYTETAITDNTCSLQITNTGKTAHTFVLYQIFKGDINDEGKLSNIVWGTGVTSEGQTALGTASTVAESVSDAKVFAAQVEPYLTGGVESTSVAANGSYTYQNLYPGYYMVLDKADSQSGQDSTYTAYIMEVVGAAVATTKIDVPTVVKKVKDIDDVTGTQSSWQDAADYDIGDHVPYQITATLPSNFADYKYYTVYTIEDTLSNGLTYDSNATITIAPEITTDVADIFDIAYANQKLTISLKSGVDLKTIDGITKNTTFTIEYTATLNSNAVAGSTGNENEVDLTYSNNPQWDGTGTPDTGKTPKDKVIVFTYIPQVDKVNSKDEPLKGAGFTLYKAVTADYAEDDASTKKLGSAIKTELAASNASIEASALVDDTYYITKAMTVLSNETSFNFNGLDAGTYVLVETTIPAGYNAFKSDTIVITAVLDADDDNPSLTSVAADKILLTSTKDDTDKNLEGAIRNNEGTTLPSTGGVGTTIFYIAGSLLAVVAVILLVTKRRMGSND